MVEIELLGITKSGSYVSRCCNGEYIGASPDECLGYAIRSLFLEGVIHESKDNPGTAILSNVSVKFREE